MYNQYNSVFFMKKVQVQRIFYPVGHGAFYVETFHDCEGEFFTFVYDCGSSNKNLIKNCIEDAVKKGDFINIKALFISHFDEDHVNGLEYLQTYMDSNTKVFIPFYYKNLLLLCPTRMQNLVNRILRILNSIGIKPIFVKSAPRLASTTAFCLLVVAHLLCPDIISLFYHFFCLLSI